MQSLLLPLSRHVIRRIGPATHQGGTRVRGGLPGPLLLVLALTPALSCRTASGGRAADGGSSATTATDRRITGAYPASTPPGTPPDTTCVPSAGVTFEFVSAPGGTQYSPMPFAVRLGRGKSAQYVPGEVLRHLQYHGGGFLLPNNGVYSIRPGAPLPVTVAFLDTLNLAEFARLGFARARVNLVLPPAPPNAFWTVKILLEPARDAEERRKDWFINRVLTGAARMPSGDSMFVDVFAGKPEYNIRVY